MARNEPEITPEKARNAKPLEFGVISERYDNGRYMVTGDSGAQYEIHPQRMQAGAQLGQRVAISRWPAGAVIAIHGFDQEDFQQRISRLAGQPTAEERQRVLQRKRDLYYQHQQEQAKVSSEESPVETRDNGQAPLDDPEARLERRLQEVTGTEINDQPFEDTVVLAPDNSIVQKPFPYTGHGFEDGTYRDGGICVEITEAGTRKIESEEGVVFWVRASQIKGYSPANVGDYGYVYALRGGVYGFYCMEPSEKVRPAAPVPEPEPQLPAAELPPEMVLTPPVSIRLHVHEVQPVLNVSERMTEMEQAMSAAQQEVPMPDPETAVTPKPSAITLHDDDALQALEAMEQLRLLAEAPIDLRDEAAEDDLLAREEEEGERISLGAEITAVSTRPHLMPSNPVLLEVLRLKSEITQLQAQVQDRQARVIDMLITEWQADRERMSQARDD